MYGDLVKRAREHRGMSQRELAENSGIAQSNISAIENGRRTPSAATLHQLLYACGFELVAVAGDRQLPLPPPDDPHLFEPGDLDEAPLVTSGTPIEVRNQMLQAALDVASSIAWGRR